MPAMKRYYNDRTPDPESSGMPRDMRDCRSIWQRFAMMFRGYNPLPWYLLVLVFLYAGNARTEDGHTHEGAVGRFYESWMMPDNRSVSCCHKMDCDAAASRFVGNRWEAQRPDGIWVVVPPGKIEQNRDSPDGRSHLCGREGYSGEYSVFCFVAGISG